MCPLVNDGQPIRRAILSPASVYSRVVGVVAYIKGAATNDWVMTPVLGNKIRLLRIKSWSTPLWDSAGDSFWVNFRYGSQQAESWVAFNRNRRVIPSQLRTGEELGFGVYREKFEFDQSMDQLYQGDAIRFGVGVERSGTISVLYVFACFEIAEG